MPATTEQTQDDDRTGPYDLERFVAAQRDHYEAALAQIRRGRKTGHWIWFVLPQVAGLGWSAMSRAYAIGSLEEARAYLDHPLLGARLRETADAIVANADRPAIEIFGSLDAMKVRSSMTLFHRAAPDDPRFGEVLARGFGGMADPATDAILATWRRLGSPATGRRP